MTPVSLWFIVLDTHRIAPSACVAIEAARPPQHAVDGVWSWSHMSPAAAEETAAVLHILGVPQSACASGVADGLPPLGDIGPQSVGAGLELVWQQGRSTVRRVHPSTTPAPGSQP